MCTLSSCLLLTVLCLSGVLAQLVMGGRYYSISPDEYIFAALNIYLVSQQHSVLCRACQWWPGIVRWSDAHLQIACGL